MKIENIRTETAGTHARLAAAIIWEDCARPAQEVFFATEKQFAEALPQSPEAFLAAVLTPALWAGEKRISTDAEVCPEFLDNLEVVTKVFQNWFPEIGQTIKIETRRRSEARNGASFRRAAFFFTGGVDSLAALRKNRLNFPLNHPASVKDGIIVFGLEVQDPRAFDYVTNTLSVIAADAALTLIPISTNLRSLNDDWVFWWKAHMGPALCAVAHALSGRISSVIIASDYDLSHLMPHGSHPLVDPNFSAFDLKVRYDGIALSRLEKIRLLTGWEVGLNNLRVCNKEEHYQRERLNCGECEKCLRTMLALLALGALEKTRAFARRDLSSDLVASKIQVYASVLPFYEELIRPLFEAGRPDLAAIVQKAVIEARGEVGLRGRIRHFDRLHLNGGLGIETCHCAKTGRGRKT